MSRMHEKWDSPLLHPDQAGGVVLSWTSSLTVALLAHETSRRLAVTIVWKHPGCLADVRQEHWCRVVGQYEIQ
ncbi:hypothetical protein BCV70DRAFT_51495 [Testicularia cyperi]|uniref:Uncharacterized protein n=1 Tax=Testicularia cyperi TaxID=1882483 RepID=A0A317XU27_9BASI|nr:hypothetical protein BCV70DRAFT_51495 [Testicularia cyperi]